MAADDEKGQIEEVIVSATYRDTRQALGQIFDLERIEVLKGPQGTLYGEGSMGGNLRLYLQQT